MKSNEVLAYEDIEPDMEIQLGTWLVTAEEIKEFASRFDPQPMHLDENAARISMAGALTASGWHTAAIAMRLFCDAYIGRSTSQGAPGVDALKWRRPVFAGDTLSGRTIVVSKRVSKSRPALGFVNVRHEITNQHGEVVCDMSNTGMFGLHNPEAA